MSTDEILLECIQSIRGQKFLSNVSKTLITVSLSAMVMAMIGHWLLLLLRSKRDAGKRGSRIDGKDVRVTSSWILNQPLDGDGTSSKGLANQARGIAAL